MESERPWVIVDRAVSYSGWSTLVDHTVLLEGGSTLQYEVDESIPFAVAALVVEDGDVLLARQYRHPVGRWIYDLPAGSGKENETPMQAARRELEEELGLVANDLSQLHTFYSNPGKAAWPVHIFTCTPGTTMGRADWSDWTR